MHKFIKTFLTSLIVVLIVSSQVLAAPIFDIPKVASDSDAVFAVSADNGISLLATEVENVPVIKNSVNFSGSSALIEWRDNTDPLTYHGTYLDFNTATRNYSGVVDPGLSDWDATNLVFIMTGSSTPPAGRYNMQLRLAQHSPYDISYFQIAYQIPSSNTIAKRYYSKAITDFQVAYGSDYYYNVIVDLPSIPANGRFYVFAHFADAGVSSFSSGGLIRSFSGGISIAFTHNNGTTEPFWDASSASGQSSSNISQNLQTNIANSSSTTAQNTTNIANSSSQTAQNTQQLVQGQNLIIDELQNLVQHISNQLYAFWDQLYNLIHLPEFQVFNDILDAINNIDIQIEVNLNSLVSAIERQSAVIRGSISDNTDKQIQNDDKNTNTVVNGYNNQSIISDNDRLSDTLNNLEQAEDALFEDAKQNLGEWAPGDMLQDFTSSLSMVSYFLQSVFDTLGNLNIPIAFSLSLSIALMFVGYYRFKGGS